MTSPSIREQYLNNQFLIAMPSLDDPNFERTVTLICQHDEQGALGVVVNRPLDMLAGEVLSQLNIEIDDSALSRSPVFRGGPVQPELGLILHDKTREQNQWDAMLNVSDDISLTMSMDVLEAMARHEGPPRALIALGYAGWGPGQLDTEMAANAWLSVPASSTVIFDTPVKERWNEAARSIGVDLNLMSSESGHA